MKREQLELKESRVLRERSKEAMAPNNFQLAFSVKGRRNTPASHPPAHTAFPTSLTYFVHLLKAD